MAGNPYRIDIPGEGPFYGRDQALDDLVRDIDRGRKSIAAVMGGRGMGKTSFAIELQRRLRARGISAVHLVRSPPATAEAFLASMGQHLGVLLDPLAVADSLSAAVRAAPDERVVFLVDEIEPLIMAPHGRALLDNVRIAWEALVGKLAIVIFGGSALRGLLASNTSPFLRSAQWLPLFGLSRDETARLLREPCRLNMDEAIVETLWEQTGGHPFLLQAIMEYAVDMGAPVIDRLFDAVVAVMHKILAPTIFPIWWDNLQAHGQGVYRRLLDARRPVQRDEQARILGPNPTPWIEILETTGVARSDGIEIVPRGTLFRQWIEENHPAPARIADVADHDDASLAGIPGAVHELERVVVRAMHRWTRSVVEYPAMFIRSDRKGSSNDRLQPERSFQLSLLTTLHQHSLIVEAEALSSERGRSDLKIRWSAQPERRACIEIKIWGRNDYADVIAQLMGYALLDDEFGCVVMVDRMQRPLAPAYERALLTEQPAIILSWSRSDDGPPGCLAFITEHARSQGRPLRIYHFLVQLPADASV
jgi:hypothetical protein